MTHRDALGTVICMPIRSRRSRIARTTLLDGAVALGLAAIEISSAALVARESGEPRLTLAAVILLLVETLPIAVLRRYPLPVWAVTWAAAATFGIRHYPDPFMHLGAVASLYGAVALGSRRTAIVVGVASMVVGMAATALAGDAPAIDYYVAAVSIVLVWLLADNQRAAVSTREHERERETRRIVGEERRRVARELHDIVAHRVSMMIVQAEAGASASSASHDAAERQFDAIATTGREALAELRRLLGVLRDDDRRAETTPQPGLDRLDALVEEMEGAGLSIGLTVEGDARPLPAGVELSGYRIVQEALTNSLRHAGPAHVEVRLRYSDDALDLEVVDDGAGPAEHAERRNSYGLVGIRERVALFGGTLSVGERPGGGFVVGARLPLTAR